MSPSRAVAHGHAGRAIQLEKFLEAQAPGKLASLQGIFIDQDLSPFFDATTMSCADWIQQSLPPGSPVPANMAGATKQCTFVHGDLNQQALAFNTTGDAIIGGKNREVWRVLTLETLIHETEHPRFDLATAGRPNPAGVSTPTCTRAAAGFELSEMAAILSEFPAAFEAAASESVPDGPLNQNLQNWFSDNIQKIKSTLEEIGCKCTCPEVDAFIIETFNFEAASWPTTRQDAFHREIRLPKWGVKWPLSPSKP